MAIFYTKCSLDSRVIRKEFYEQDGTPFTTDPGELLDRTRFYDHRQAQSEFSQYIEGRYSPHCRNQGLDYQSPMDLERCYQEAA